jgi:hypothetical protein
MLEIITSFFVVGVGVVLGLVILAYAAYITLFPLIRTIGGGMQALKAYGEQRLGIAEEQYALLNDAQVGLTMADGGDRIDEEKAPEEKTSDEEH